MKKYAEVIEVEVIDDIYECFTFRVKDIEFSINLNTIKNKELFEELVDCLIDGIMIDINKVIDTIWDKTEVEK
jgi:hypothetical protein